MGNAIPTYHVCIKTKPETVCTKHAYDAIAANQIATMSGFDRSKVELVSPSGPFGLFTTLPGKPIDLLNLPDGNSMKYYLQCELKCRHLARNYSQPLAQKPYYELCILNCENK